MGIFVFFSIIQIIMKDGIIISRTIRIKKSTQKNLKITLKQKSKKEILLLIRRLILTKKKIKRPNYLFG